MKGIGWGKRSFGEEYEAWPKTESGEPVRPAFLLHADSLDYNDEMTVSLLKAYGIPVVRQYPNDGEFGNVILGMSGNGVDLYVPETQLTEAHNLLSAEIAEDEERNS